MCDRQLSLWIKHSWQVWIWWKLPHWMNLKMSQFSRQIPPKSFVFVSYFFMKVNSYLMYLIKLILKNMKTQDFLEDLVSVHYINQFSMWALLLSLSYVFYLPYMSRVMYDLVFNVFFLFLFCIWASWVPCV